jgi:hypothetical protein
VASITLQGVWLTLASDQTQSLHLQFATQINPQPQTPGDVRMYGNGRYVGLSAGATQQQYAIAAEAVPAEDVATLRSWDGVLLCYRDDRAAKTWGLFRSPQVTWHPYNTDADVSFTFVEVTYSDLA